MVTSVISSLPGKKNFTIRKNDGSNDSHFLSPTNNICLSLPHHQPKKIQKYSQFRCAEYQRVNNFFDTQFLLVKIQPNILTTHPGIFYLQQKTKMNNQSNTQEYCRYRDAQSRIPTKVIEQKK